MPLSSGTRLGPYEVLGPLGAGGMGEVYRAKDTRLDRSVAIKVLPSHLVSNPDLRARFEREARVVSSLNHPHICVLHDVGHQDGTDYIVMELVEGETLLDRLKKGPLPLDQTLRYGIEIADAMDKAHRQGVIHRDLKPGNVMLTNAGSKLMDFGLAKLGLPSPSGRGVGGEGVGGEGVSALATREKALTGDGTLLGTFQYMSPEQLEGKDADARADIWALGCVLYEMATGKRAFEGKSQASLVSAIMTSEPQPIAQLQPMSPAALDRLVKVCLAKDPDDRLQTAHDVMQELKWIAEAGAATGGTETAQLGHQWLAWTLASTLGLVLLGMAGVLHRRASQPTPVVRFDVPPPEGTELQFYLAVSPDGTHLAFTARGADGLDRLYLRSLESGKSEPVSGTEGALQPFWSPDGHSLGFFAQGKLKRVEIGGAAPQAICGIPELRGATWSRDGVILFGIGGAYGLRRVAATGGVPEPVSSPDAAQGETSHRWPFFLPDGRRYLYVAFGPAGDTISVGSLDGQQPERLIETLSAPTYAASGHLLFVRDGALRTQEFDAGRTRLIGEAATLAAPVQLDRQMWGGAPVSAGGAVVAYRGGEVNTTQLTWLDREGREQGLVGPPGDYQDPALSPDGTRLVANMAGSRQLAVLTLGVGAFVPFTFGSTFANAPSWSSDGRSIAYASNRNGTFDIFLAPSSGGGPEEMLVHGATTSWDPCFSPDGRVLLYESSDPKTQYDLWFFPLLGARKPQPFLRTEASEVHASFSPNGRWLAYASDVSGRAEVYVRAFPSGEGPWQVSTEGGDQAQWRRDGSELYYLSPDRRLMAVAVNGEGAAFKAAPPKALFRARVRAPGIVAVRNDYVVTADGQRFLINKLVDDPAKATITVVVNWAARLAR